MERHSDAYIKAAIEAGGRQMESVLSEIYQQGQWQHQLRVFVEKRGGRAEDAEDVFQEGLRLFVLNIRGKKYQGNGGLKQYFFAICRNLWFKRFAKEQRQDDFRSQAEGNEIVEKTPEHVYVEKERLEQIDDLLGKLGEPCRTILLLWQMSFSMKEIAPRVNYKSEGVVRKKKSQCMKRLLELLEQEPAWKQWIQ